MVYVHRFPTEESINMPATIRIHRILTAPPERVYRAFLEPDAIVKWNAPFGFTAKVHHLDARAGGSYRMSFINFGTGTAHTFGGEYLELVLNERIVSTDKFEDPNLPGEMKMTITFQAVSCGTELNIRKACLTSFRQSCVISAGRSHWTCWRNWSSRRFPIRVDGPALQATFPASFRVGSALDLWTLNLEWE